MKLRPFTGRLPIAAEPTVELTWERVTSSTGAAPVTVTVSCTAATPSSMRRLTVCPTVRRTSEALRVWNPASSAVTSYEPMGRSSKANRPWSFVTVPRVAAVAEFTAVTVTPGSTAPEPSTIAP